MNNSDLTLTLLLWNYLSLYISFACLPALGLTEGKDFASITVFVLPAPTTGDVNTDHLGKVVFASFLHYQVTIFCSTLC